MKLASRITWLAAGLSLLLAVGCAGNEGGGGCDPACDGFETCCDGVCVLTGADSNNCGMCGVSCQPGQFCRNSMCEGTPTTDGGTGTDGGGSTGMCRPECPSTQRCCGTSCVDRSVPLGSDGRGSSSFQNCNGCGLACDAERASACTVLGEAPRCMCGEFNACNVGDVCASTGGTFSCVNLSTDPNNCGAMGNTCNPGESCSGGMCVCGGTGAACAAGEGCCGGACVDVSSDPMNCGGCGTECGPNAPQCVSSSCICEAEGRACELPVPGSFLEPGTTGESCCPGMGCVANTDESCVCEACGEGEECIVSGGELFPGLGGGEVEVCCGEDDFLGGCGGGGGFPFPIP